MRAMRVAGTAAVGVLAWRRVYPLALRDRCLTWGDDRR